MMRHRMFLFGEAEKGELCTPIFCQNLLELSETVGNPTKTSMGVFFAIQTLLFERDLFFFRVKEEGFSVEDYLQGIKILRNKKNFKPLSAICIPGVGNADLIHQITQICNLYQSCLILSEKDFYDYLTTR
ncbi:MAG: hypothetical protein L0207_01345 [Chlamydiae bacterium]|nr:hypothetical protein [Chlamydiota bacterium]